MRTEVKIASLIVVILLVGGLIYWVAVASRGVEEAATVDGTERDGRFDVETDEDATADGTDTEDTDTTAGPGDTASGTAGGTRHWWETEPEDDTAGTDETGPDGGGTGVVLPGRGDDGGAREPGRTVAGRVTGETTGETVAEVGEETAGGSDVVAVGPARSEEDDSDTPRLPSWMTGDGARRTPSRVTYGTDRRTPTRGTPGREDAAAAAAGTYEVEEGDTYWSIAKAQYGDPMLHKLLVEANKSIPPSKLRPGMTIKVPEKPTRIPGVPAGAERAEQARHGKVEVDSLTGKRHYVVKQGDNGFWGVSKAVFGTGKHYRQIMAMNPQFQGKHLHPGDRILVPEKPSEPTRSAATGAGRTTGGTTDRRPRRSSTERSVGRGEAADVRTGAPVASETTDGRVFD
jgi:nucleoid-associated protein YgaU